MDRQDIFKKADEYASNLIKSDLFVELIKIKKQINAELSDLIKEFKIKREKFEEIQKYGILDTSKKIQLEFQKVKEELYSKEIVQKYFKLEREIQSELSLLSKELAKKISNRF